MLVGLAATVTVVVAEEAVVGAGEGVDVAAGNGVPVMTVTLGVRKSTQPGCVRIAASTGSMNPSGLLATKVPFGSIRESILAFSSQPGEKRNASCPATSTRRNPITKMMMTTIVQSSCSRSTTFIFGPVDWQSHKYRGAGVCCFVMSRAFQPDASLMGVDNPARDG